MFSLIGWALMIAVAVAAYKGIGYRMMYVALIFISLAAGGAITVTIGGVPDRSAPGFAFAFIFFMVSFGSFIGSLIFRSRK